MLLAPAYEQPEKADCQTWCDPRNGSDAAFQKCLADLGTRSGHPELAKVPWALWGHSGGGHWAGGMVLLHPDRVAAAWQDAQRVQCPGPSPRHLPELVQERLVRGVGDRAHQVDHRGGLAAQAVGLRVVPVAQLPRQGQELGRPLGVLVHNGAGARRVHQRDPLQGGVEEVLLQVPDAAAPAQGLDVVALEAVHGGNP